MGLSALHCLHSFCCTWKTLEPPEPSNACGVLQSSGACKLSGALYASLVQQRLVPFSQCHSQDSHGMPWILLDILHKPHRRASSHLPPTTWSGLESVLYAQRLQTVYLRFIAKAQVWAVVDYGPAFQMMHYQGDKVHLRSKIRADQRQRRQRSRNVQ